MCPRSVTNVFAKCLKNVRNLEVCYKIKDMFEKFLRVLEECPESVGVQDGRTWPGD